MLYIYTSGTTGFPKPTIIRHARFTMGGNSLAILLGETPDDCVYAPTPLYHGYSNFVGFAPAFHTGACFASRRHFSASDFLLDDAPPRRDALLYVGELCRYLLRTPPSPATATTRSASPPAPGCGRTSGPRSSTASASRTSSTPTARPRPTSAC